MQCSVEYIRISKRVAKKVCDDISIPDDEYDADIEVTESMKKNQESAEVVNIDIEIDIGVRESMKKNPKTGGEREHSWKRDSDEDREHKKDSDEDSSEENSSEEE